jgi:hypothetical protein
LRIFGDALPEEIWGKRYGRRDMGTLTIIPLPGREREGRECKKY